MNSLLKALALALPLLAAAAAFAAERIDLGPGVTDYQRFVSYPHLDKALAAEARGDGKTAIRHYRRALDLVPGNPVIARYLLAACQRFGDASCAPVVGTAEAVAVPAPPAVPVSAPAVVPAERPAEKYPATARKTVPAAALRDPVAEALAKGDAAAVLAAAPFVWEQGTDDAAVLDSTSFQLADAGRYAEALTLLVETWPWGKADDDLRAVLLDRTAFVARAAGATADQLAALRSAPSAAESAALRARRAHLFAMLGDCPTLIQLLGDFAAGYGRDDYLRLGDCLRASDPRGAQRAYQEAFARVADAQTVRALAYQAHTNGDYAIAAGAWNAMPKDSIANEDRLAAATTAVARRAVGDARRWLDDYAANGGAPDATYWRLRAQARDATDTRSAVADLEQAVAAAPQDAETRRVLAWARLADGDRAGARQAFTVLRADGASNALGDEQLAYLDIEAGDMAAARAGLARVIDAVGDTDQARSFRLRRAHEDLGQRWNASASLWSATRVASVSGAPDPGSAFRSFLELSAGYRLGSDRMAVDERFTAYARLVADGGTGADALPADNPLLGAGLRVRPWRSQVAYLSLERQWPLDDADPRQPDSMLRASASFLDQGRWSDDWHVAGSGWSTRSLFLDAARFVDAERTSLTADLAVGYHHKLRAGQTLQPRAHLQYANTLYGGAHDEDLRLGIGLQWNLWHGETRHDAWRYRTAVGIEVQHAFRTFLQEEDVAALSVSTRW